MEQELTSRDKETRAQALPDETDADALPPLTPKQIRTLGLVALLTAFVVVGLFVLFVKLIGGFDRSDKATAEVTDAAPLSQQHRQDINAAVDAMAPDRVLRTPLPPGGRVIATTDAGDHIMVTVEDPAGTSILLIDKHSGETTRVIRLDAVENP